MSAPIWNEEFGSPDGSYSVSGIQIYFEYIFKKHEAVTDNPSIMIYVSKIENRITFKITCATMKLLESTKSKINKEKKQWKCASFRSYWSSINTL